MGVGAMPGHTVSVFSIVRFSVRHEKFVIYEIILLVYKQTN